MSLCDSGQKKMCQEFGMKRYKVTYSFVCVNIHGHAWEAVKKRVQIMHVHYLQVSEKKYARKEEMRKHRAGFFILKITDFCIFCSRGQSGDLIM